MQARKIAIQLSGLDTLPLVKENTLASALHFVRDRGKEPLHEFCILDTAYHTH